MNNEEQNPQQTPQEQTNSQPQQPQAQIITPQSANAQTTEQTNLPQQPATNPTQTSSTGAVSPQTNGAQTTEQTNPLAPPAPMAQSQQPQAQIITPQSAGAQTTEQTNMPQQPTPITQAQQPNVVQTPFQQPQQQFQPNMSQNSFSQRINNKSKSIKILLGVVGAVVFVGLLFLGVSMFTGGGVSIDELESASSKSSETRTKLFDLSRAVSDVDKIYKTKAEINDSVTESTRMLEGYKSEHEMLKNEPGIEHPEVKEKFTSYEGKFKEYTDFIPNYIASMSALTSAFAVCDDKVSYLGLDTSVADIQSCTSGLNQLGTLPQEDINSTKGQIISQITALEALAKTHNALPTSEYTKRSEIRSQYVDGYKKARELFIDQVSANELKMNEIRPHDELDKLSNALIDVIQKYYRDNE